MNTPTPAPVPPTPTPQTLPTLGGLLQGLAVGWGTVKLGALLGLPADFAYAAAGAIVSGVTSWIHKISQKNHWKLFNGS